MVQGRLGCPEAEPGAIGEHARISSRLESPKGLYLSKTESGDRGNPLKGALTTAAHSALKEAAGRTIPTSSPCSECILHFSTWEGEGSRTSRRLLIEQVGGTAPTRLSQTADLFN